MKNACWAAWWHFRSTDQNPHHCLCNPDRCGMYKDPKFTHEAYEIPSLHIINVRPTGDTCTKVGLNSSPEHYYLIFDGHELNVNNTIRESGIINVTENSNHNYPELRLKFLYQLEESAHIAAHVVLTSPEELVYREVFEILDSPTKQDIMSDFLKPLIEQICKHKSQSSAFSSKLISMPVFTKQVLDELPSVHISVPLKPNEFDWNEFLQYLAIDLGIDKNDMFLMSAQEGSTKYEIKFKATISITEFIAPQKLSDDIKEILKIEAKLSNFSENQSSLSSENLTDDDIDTALELMQRPAIIDPQVWKYLREKRRKISGAILHAFQRSLVEYVIESMLLVQNEELYDKYIKCAVHGEEMVLFHGTKSANMMVYLI
ncbi:unnamed protein product [Didymodactylos carnosus]|uniref:Uncharacterized protein n=1 Tax=Didymodactylos carnosus TaxID=1234261 RepID=A0A815LKK5_9BILA|nr:unnamed protein product [Didymodactylos carnosus]CAF4299358.1 unnamed protein product [Didymodactylos carnosus]